MILSLPYDYKLLIYGGFIGCVGCGRFPNSYLAHSGRIGVDASGQFIKYISGDILCCGIEFSKRRHLIKILVVKLIHQLISLGLQFLKINDHPQIV